MSAIEVSSTEAEDLELLRRFEPVVRCAGGERFHPLAVESYLERCDLFQRRRGLAGLLGRARDVTDTWNEYGASADDAAERSGSRRAATLGRFGADHYLRFLDQEAWKLELRQRHRGDSPPIAPPLIGLCMLLVLVALAAWALKGLFGWGWTGPLWAIGVAATLLASTAILMGIRGRYGAERSHSILESALAVAGLAVLIWAWNTGETSLRLVIGFPAGVLAAGGLAAWIVRTFSPTAARVLRLAAGLPIALAVIYGIASAAVDETWAIGLASVVLVLGLLPLLEQSASAFMALGSPLRRAAAEQAVAIEGELRSRPGEGHYPYYGRVWRDPRGSQVILQYFFFYAFNDWRGHGGINFHEADWEGILVSLSRSGTAVEPGQVVAFQHHAHQRCDWTEVERLGEHPVLYVAAGSHATYLKRGRRALSELVRGDAGRRIVGFLARVRARSDKAAREGRQAAVERLALSTEETEDLAPLVADVADGQGLVIGPVRPPDVAADRHREWSPELVDDGTPWIEFKGLWGVRTKSRNESGPPGPKWKREEERIRGEAEVRRVWGDPAALFSSSTAGQPSREGESAP